MSQSSIAPLEALLVRLQAQWGEEVLRPVRALQAQSIPVIPTGSPSLDNALRGGISLVRLTELCGRPTSGMATLVYRLIAQAQRGGAYALWLDLPGTFDPASAARCGLHLEQLFILRLDAPDEALPILRDLRPGELPAETSLAAVRLLIERRTWLSDRHLVIGCRSRLTLLKGAAGPARAVDLDIYFEGP